MDHAVLEQEPDPLALEVREDERVVLAVAERLPALEHVLEQLLLPVERPDEFVDRAELAE